jgi:predicted membrane channel-forming protein YqfA (hemolysin III family)
MAALLILGLWIVALAALPLREHGGWSVESIAVHVIATCSILHTLLPPWDVLAEFPRAQRYYKVLVYTIGYMALNGRSTVYQSISISKQASNAPEAKP